VERDRDLDFLFFDECEDAACTEVATDVEEEDEVSPKKNADVVVSATVAAVAVAA
tara:strand:+ start:1006 stop:1170 length:165 start_codon:yes stop_codon:yes gene_type:complete